MTNKAKPLGFWMLSALVAGNMVGAGIFLLPTSLAAFGSISLLGWLITTIGAMLLALVFSTLSKNMPLSGGPYAYCRAAYGDFMGFLVAYNYWIGMWVGSASVALAFTAYLSFFYPVIANDSVLSFIVSVGVVWSLTTINIFGVRAAGLIQVIFTVLKLLPLILLSVVGIFYVELDKLSDFNVSGLGHMDAMVGAAALTLWSFIGLESASIAADKVETPTKVIPRATIFGTLIAAITYIVSTFVIFGTVDNHELVNSTAPYALSAENIFGRSGGAIIAFGAIFSCYGSLNGWIMLQGQLPLAAAKDGVFPKIFGKVNANGTPVIGLIIASMLITMLLALSIDMKLIEQFKLIISIAVFATLIAYVFTTIGEMILFHKYPEKFSSSNFIKATIISILALLYSVWMIYGLGYDIIFYGSLLFMSGFPVYGIMKYSKKTHS